VSRAHNNKPSLHCATFGDMDEFAAALRGADIDVRAMSRPVCGWRLHHITMDNISLQRWTEPAALVARGAMHPDVIGFVCLLKKTGVQRFNGCTLGASTLAVYGPGSEHISSRNVPGSELVTATIPFQEYARLMVRLTGREPARRASCALIELAPDARNGLNRLLRRTFAAFRGNQTALESRQACRALQETLIAAFLEVTQQIIEPARVRCAHQAIVRRAEDYLQEHLQDPIYLSDLCTAVQASERTIRNAFLEFYGVGPMRYLRLIRLNQAHKALRRAEPDHTEVTAVLTRLGIWDFGQFACEYKALFGEAPSQTLRGRLKPR